MKIIKAGVSRTEKAMAPHSRIPAGNPMDRGACGLQFMGLQRVTHKLVTKPQPQLTKSKESKHCIQLILSV